MATYTENYNLLVTEPEDRFNIADYNGNFETIDTLMAENDAAVQEVNEKLGTPDEGETVFSLLKGGSSSPIKSIQHITKDFSNSTKEQNIPINPVTPEKCFVILERLYSDTHNDTRISYTLNASSLDVICSLYTSENASYGFWIIEFN